MTTLPSLPIWQLYSITKQNYTQQRSDYVSKLYSCQQLAELYGVKKITIWDWIRKKKLPAIRIGKEYRVSEEDIKIFEEARRTVKR